MVNMRNETEINILNTARRAFVQKGFQGARMQDIADEAGINKAMLHYYFRSKEKLYREIVVDIMDELLPRFAQVMGSEGSFAERVDRLVDAYIHELSANPDVPFFLMSELSQKQEGFVRELKKRSAFFPQIQSFLAQMQTEMAEGKIRQVSPIQLLLSIMGMTIFPFMAKPIFCTILEMPEAAFSELMRERKAFLLDFIHCALRPG